MVLNEEEKKEQVHPANFVDRRNGKIEAQKEDESRIELLQRYLKMALESEEDPKIKK